MSVLLLIAAVLTGAAVGAGAMARAAAWGHEDKCQACRREAAEAALRDAEGASFGGTDE